MHLCYSSIPRKDIMTHLKRKDRYSEREREEEDLAEYQVNSLIKPV